MIILEILFFIAVAIWLVFFGLWIYYAVKENIDRMNSTVIKMLCGALVINIINLLVHIVK